MICSYLDKTASLTPAAYRIICDKATEYPYSGEYNTQKEPGRYLCRRCGLALFQTNTQFSSGCGWPSFDEDTLGTIAQTLDADGQRLEVTCKRCNAHLGHVFFGEQLTVKNTRYCINAAALDRVDDEHIIDTQEAIVAGGCFWGVEYLFKTLTGVVKAQSGYIGGHIDDPYYAQICQGHTGHLEAVRVVFDPNVTSYQAIIKYFFEIHDPTQSAGQGPDHGSQYQSAIFCYQDQQHQDAQHLSNLLKQKGYPVVTQLRVMQPFWQAEQDHQNYYSKHNKLPYCHQWQRKFD